MSATKGTHKGRVTEHGTATGAMLTIPAASAILACAEITTRRMVASGTLPAYRVGRSRMIRVKRADVEALLRPVTDVADILGGDAA